LVSHSHNDHCQSIGDIINLGIETYALKETFEAKITNFKGHRQNYIKHGDAFKVGNFTVMAFELKHDVPCLGFLIHHVDCGKVLFITDTYFCEYKFTGLNQIIIEANYSHEIIEQKFGAQSGMMFLKDRILKSHFSLENCKGLLEANDLTAVNNIVLIHLSDTNSNAHQFQQQVKWLTGKTTTVAQNGITIDFNLTPF
jgi:phosphoribosyl 1,2-cyclic phosphodiesterase